MAEDRKFNRWHHRPTGSILRLRLNVAMPFKPRTEATSGGPLVVAHQPTRTYCDAAFNGPALSLPAGDAARAELLTRATRNGKRVS